MIDYKLAREVTPLEQARGAREAAAPALPARASPSTGAPAGRRHLPPAAGHLGAPARAAPCSTRWPATSPATASTTTTSSTREGFEELLADARAPGRRDRRPDARAATSAATPARGRAARPRRLPALLRIRPDLPPRPGAIGRAGQRRGGGAVSARGRPRSRRPRSPPSGRDVLVEAGAGSGKTGVMVDRYCRLVCDERGLADAVLAFTFTDKAAAELRQRIRAELARRAAEGSERAAELLGEIGGAWVTTIHGFCNRLLAAYPVAAGIDPRFRILDGPEAHTGRPRRLRRSAGEFLARGDSDRERTVAAFGITGMRGMVIGAYAELRSRGMATPRLPEPPAVDPERRAAASRRGGRRDARGARSPSAANRILVERALAAPGRWAARSDPG